MVWFDPSTTGIQSSPAVSVPTGIAWEPPSMPVGVTKMITGSVLSSYGAPEPNRALQFQKRVNLTGNWAYVLNTLPDDNGAFAFEYASVDSIAEYRLVFPGTGVYQASVSSIHQQIFSVATVTSPPTLPSSIYWGGTPFSANGTVRDQNGLPVPVGQVELWIRNYNGPAPGTTWRKAAAPAADVAANGGYSISCPVPTTRPGPYEWRVKYLGGQSGYYRLSESTVVSSPLKLSSTSITAGALDYTSAAFSWSAVPGATGYDVQHGVSAAGAFTPMASVSSAVLSHKHTGLLSGSYHKYQVTPTALDAADAVVYGPASPMRACTIGTPAVVKSSGGVVVYTALCTDSDSWRSTDGWAYSDAGDSREVKQGYLSAESSNWYGVMRYNGAAFRTWITNHSKGGANCIPHVVANKTRVYMRRNATSGNGSHAVAPRWFVTSAVPRVGGQPSYAGGTVAGSYTLGAVGWTELPAHWGRHVLMNENIAGTGVCNSLMLMYNGTTTYAAFSSPYINSGYCQMEYSCSWNFTAAAAVASKWI